MKYKIKRRTANWIGHILRRNCLLKYIIGGDTGGGDTRDGTTRNKT
jgi:hypothetical protein